MTCVSFERRKEGRGRTFERDYEEVGLVSDPALEEGEGVDEGAGVYDAGFALAGSVASGVGSTSTAGGARESGVAREGDGVYLSF